MSTPSWDDDLDAKLAVTLQKALRRPKFGQLEHLLASELAVAAFNIDPLQKIRHIFEAYMALSEEEANQVFAAEEKERINKLYLLCISLLNTVEEKLGPEKMCMVPFGFSPKQAGEYFALIDAPPEMYKVLSEEADPASARFLVVKFVKAAMPFAVQVMRRIIENYVSPEAWTQMLQQAGRQTPP